jgi:hypothetical protein
LARSVRSDSRVASVGVEALQKEDAMDESEIGDLWRNEEHSYAVITARGAMEREERTGLSHAAAMTLAEELRRDGKVAVVMHVVGNKRYEVDRYPAR